MDSLLLKAGFNFSKPDVGLGWKVFKDFLQIRIPKLKSVSVGLECVHDLDQDIVFLSFVRTFDEYGYCGCAFSHTVTQQLRKINFKDWWWPNDEGLRSWENEIEKSGALRVSTQLENWAWLGHSL